MIVQLEYIDTFYHMLNYNPGRLLPLGYHVTTVNLMLITNTVEHTYKVYLDEHNEICMGKCDRYII